MTNKCIFTVKGSEDGVLGAYTTARRAVERVEKYLGTSNAGFHTLSENRKRRLISEINSGWFISIYPSESPSSDNWIYAEIERWNLNQ